MGRLVQGTRPGLVQGTREWRLSASEPALPRGHTPWQNRYYSHIITTGNEESR
jgi:hypothetical protein